jgi:arabinogalactan endo-1,4-beta-galactosidase
MTFVISRLSNIFSNMKTLILQILLVLSNVTFGVEVADSSFIKGGAMGHVPLKEGHGFVYKENGTPKDPFQSLRDHGATFAMVELWDTPSEKNQWRSLENCLALAKRAKAAGLNLVLNIFYSDDYEHTLPDSWPTRYGDVKRKVYSYTKSVLQAFKKNGTLPLYVKVGNEVDLKGGFLLPHGEYNTKKFYELLKIGNQAVKDFDPNIKTIIHTYSKAGNNEMMRTAIENEIPFDVYGISYYKNSSKYGELTISSQDVLSDLERKLKYWGKLGKKVLIMETATLAWSTQIFPNVERRYAKLTDYPTSAKSAGQLLRDMVKILRRDPNALGMMIWPTDHVYMEEAKSAWGDIAWWDSNTGNFKSKVADGFLEDESSIVAIKSLHSGNYISSVTDKNLYAYGKEVSSNSQLFKMNCKKEGCSFKSKRSRGYISEGTDLLNTNATLITPQSLWKLDKRTDGNLALSTISSGKYLNVDNVSGKVQSLWKDLNGLWQSFELISFERAPKMVAIYSNAVGRYLRVDKSTGQIIADSASTPYRSTKFKMVCDVNGSCAFQSLLNDKYITVAKGQLKADGNSIGRSQELRGQIRSDGKVSFYSEANDSYLEVNLYNNNELRSTWALSRDDAWQSFSIVPID